MEISIFEAPVSKGGWTRVDKGRHAGLRTARSVAAIRPKLYPNLWREEKGQDLFEYTLLPAFVAFASAAVFLGVGRSAKETFTTAKTRFAAAAPG